MSLGEFVTRYPATGLEVAGVLVILLGALVSTALAVTRYVRRPVPEGVYRDYRRQLSRAILLGLELLVAADIIRTVAITPTYRSVGVLAAIVVIRTFLSFTLEVEVSGKWPWQHQTEGSAPPLRPTQ